MKRCVKKCPKGVFCIETTTLVFLALIVGICFFVFYNKFSNKSLFEKLSMPLYHYSHGVQKDIMSYFPFNDRLRPIPTPNHVYSNAPNNVLMNPHVPPLKNNHYFRGDSGDVRGVPINVATNSINVAYGQVGILTRNDAKETILPLMGKPLQTNRQKWQYYTMSGKHNNVKLPISKAGRNCTGEYGCDELFNGDEVYVEGYNDSFKVVIYETNGPRYIPL